MAQTFERQRVSVVYLCALLRNLFSQSEDKARWSFEASSSSYGTVSSLSWVYMSFILLYS